MTSYSLLILCLFLGIATARLIGKGPALATSLNWWVLNIALPATVLHLTPTIRFSWDMWFLIASMWLVFACAWALFAIVGASRGWSRGRIGALTLVCGLGNTSFIGYPMIEALRGKDALALAVVADQAGVFLMLAIGGALVTSIYASNRPQLHALQVAKRVASFPAFIALVIGLIVGASSAWPPFVDTVLQRLGDTLVPLALFSVGLQVRWELQRAHLGAAAVALSYKLILAPLIVYGLGIAIGISGLSLIVAVLQSAMAPMISATILAEQHDLEPRLANFILTLGIVLSFVTVPIWNRWL
ncbi:MAG TPA: AEC family transporter [Steroidobacteraceae bacterium]|nr:AEC family transporter [Steroidobacteraceae bacterium]